MHIALEAHHPAANHHRAYEVALSRELLGDWVVSVRYGRTGGAGREQRFAVATVEEARRIVRDRLARRLTARRRIDCDYRLVRFFATADFTPAPWLPEGLRAGLASCAPTA